MPVGGDEDRPAALRALVRFLEVLARREPALLELVHHLFELQAGADAGPADAIEAGVDEHSHVLRREGERERNPDGDDGVADAPRVVEAHRVDHCLLLGALEHRFHLRVRLDTVVHVCILVGSNETERTVNDMKNQDALRVDIGTRTLWIPKSVVHDDSEVYRAGHGDDGSEGTLVVARWFAEKEGLE